MKAVSEITLKWFDDAALMEDDPRRLTETFLASLGVSSEVAVDVMEALLHARAQDRALKTAEIRDEIIKLRKKRRVKAAKGMTLRNIQIWLKYFKSLKLVDRTGERVRFTGNKRPSQVFEEYTKPVIHESASFVGKLLKRTEEVYGIK
jgi:hypothetical protein